MAKLVTIIQKNFHQFIKLKHSSIVTIAAPLLAVLLAIVLITQNTNIIKVSYFSPDDITEESELYNSLNQGNFVLLETESAASCTTQVREGKTNGCAVISQTSTASDIDIYVTQPNRHISNEVEELDFPENTVITPHILEIKYLANSLFTIILILIIMLSSVLLSSTFVIAEKKSAAYFRSHITPTRDYTFIVARFLTTLIIVTIIAAVVLVTLSSLFQINIMSSFFAITITILLIASVYTLIGILLGNIFVSTEVNILFLVIVSFISMLFSRTILTFKEESIMNYFILVNPYEIGTYILNKTLYTQIHWTTLAYNWLLLIVYCLVLFIITFKVQSSLRFSTLFKIHKEKYHRIRQKFEEEIIGVRNIHLKEVFKRNEPTDVDKIEKHHRSLLKKLIHKSKMKQTIQSEIKEINKQS
ncbi:ABC transporter permease [Candidatus Woesearchaeota archaeon]|mgnify:CR=1 FL=1|jgi:hypothetical protein|nr:ABC transporter permease [Candidatus Woesearchaeota archaeon]MBT3538343.1 ABC transporter permease [Candidatus Woesearchaeota archaeon]MBT4698320.1 ABC transporter permease [Candidatus Woesearchaeota archaeon]MBT4716781.1 ABC transporter permease [Candidatus Woesearchaeota archaeon]MBT7106012.1 ABC transporter permease [Candidatus Woesearchaeota archaeon]